MAQVALKCGEKIDITLLEAAKSIGCKVSGLKFFAKGKEISKGQSLQPGMMIEGDHVIGVQGLGKPKTWKRYEKPYEHSGWSNNGRYADALKFTPTKNILFAGFASWASKEEPSYDHKYQIEINDNEVLKTEWANRSGWVGEKGNEILQVFFEEPIEISSGTSFVIRAWIKKTGTEDGYTNTYYGDQGDNYKDIPNEDMGLFELDSAQGSDNGTSVYSGHFPQVFYHLA